jgi:hypothetical protein
MNLSQSEADGLLRTPKLFKDDIVLEMPQTETGLFEHILVSQNKKEEFILNYGRYGRDSLKLKYQTRAREVVVLARLDISGRPHRNPPTEVYPEGEFIDGPHLHLYREGFDDKFAFSLAQIEGLIINDFNNGIEVLESFLRFCAVDNIPHIQVLL